MDAGTRATVRTNMGGAIEFFAGMGLVRRALETGPRERTWRTALANDVDPIKGRLYGASFADADETLQVRDVAELTPGELPRATLWTASFPCTDLSLAGRGAGIHAGQSGAVWAMLDLLERADHRPRWLLFENVPSLLTSHGGADLAALVARVNALGYGVDPLLIDAARFTAQSRPRVFLIATREDATGAPAPADPYALDPCDARPERILRAMRARPDLTWHARPLPAFERREPTLKEVFEDLPTGDDRWWPEARAAYFMEQVHPGHMDWARRAIDGEGITRACAFRRVRTIDGVKRSLIELRRDGRAGCLRTPKGGSAKQIVFEAGGAERRVRFMTAREAARLQGVRDHDFDNLNDRFRQHDLLFGLGDAVCVPAVRWALDRVCESGEAASLRAVEERQRRGAAQAAGAGVDHGDRVVVGAHAP